MNCDCYQNKIKEIRKDFPLNVLEKTNRKNLSLKNIHALEKFETISEKESGNIKSTVKRIEPITLFFIQTKELKKPIVYDVKLIFCPFCGKKIKDEG